MITIKTYNIIDLFSGAGGLSLGFKQTGKINIVAAAENNPNARKTYKRNFAEVKRLYPDVRTIDYNELKEAVGQVDIVIGGPPCQGFSNANRQHSTIISMNNRLVKEYVRAICELQPTAFVMENVAMLKSQVHRFFLEENDMTNAKILNLPLREDNIEILPQNMNFEGSRELILSAPNGVQYAWAETFYKTINLLYRYRINQPKFDLSLTKYEKKLVPQLQELFRGFNGTESSNRIQQKDSFMAIQILNYIENKEKREESFDRVIQAIRDSLLIQRALLKVKELSDNNIHVFDYVEKDGGLYATVKSYSVLDYLQGILENEPYNYLPFGKLSVLQGNPGEGKTYFAMHLAAACTNGKLLPNMERMEPFNVIYQTAEDGLGDTVKPRLIEAGADLDRVLVIDDSEVQLTLSDERIERAIIENNARLVIIDPIQAYLGADVDMNRANEVRPIFMRLGQVAQRTGCAILLIGHLNKAAGMQSLQRGLGSIDIAAAVRSVLFIGKLKHDPTMRILTHEKSSLAPPGASLAFSLGDEGGFRWVGEYDITADEMLSGIEPQRETKTQQAKDLICALLAGGKQVLSEDIDKAALERGIPGRTVRDAKRELGDALKSKIVEGRKKVFWME